MPSQNELDLLRLQVMAAEYKARVGARIREAREARGWTQTQLARELPGTVDGASVSRWETGKVMPQPDTLDALATALEVDVSYFLVEKPRRPVPDLMAELGGSQAEGLGERLDRILALLEYLASEDARRRLAEEIVSELEDVAEACDLRAATRKLAEAPVPEDEPAEPARRPRRAARSQPQRERASR